MVEPFGQLDFVLNCNSFSDLKFIIKHFTFNLLLKTLEVNIKLTIQIGRTILETFFIYSWEQMFHILQNIELLTYHLQASVSEEAES